ncbi:Methylglyoxal synthase [bioreactor metagenome]|uniref:Methylglyoxal synthase n=1 Tax=bioreactor metagenome TaxID=1076179 RepID=A0A645G870_9ZZZZ
MTIALLANEEKKELLTQFCIAYCGILSKHTLISTSATGKMISDATGLTIERLLNEEQGGTQQIASRISYNEIDVLLFFRGTATRAVHDETEIDILRLCDIYNIPFATNIATAEAVIMALGRGDLDWRVLVNPKNKKNI